MQRTAWRLIALSFLVSSVAACGDAPTSDARGYTKAPLERVGFFIKPEQPSPYRQFVRLNRPDGQRLTVTDSAR